MNLVQAMILGVVQGITEFLPISSSAHLLITRRLFGISENESYLIFDAILHLATALVITLYFFDDIKKIVTPLFGTYITERRKSLKIITLIIIASIPAIVIGFSLEDYLTSSLRGISVIVVTLVIGAILLILAEKLSKKVRGKSKEQLSWGQALMIGFFQTLALIPGMSRSGSTLSGGVFMGLSKIEATKFAFLLGLPVLYGVGGIKLMQSFSVPGVAADLIIAGSIAAIVSGYISVKVLMYIVREKTLTWFAGYRIILAAVLLWAFVL
jgi:undecaprenyl-diphosphatase